MCIDIINLMKSAIAFCLFAVFGASFLEGRLHDGHVSNGTHEFNKTFSYSYNSYFLVIAFLVYIFLTS